VRVGRLVAVQELAVLDLGAGALRCVDWASGSCARVVGDEVVEGGPAGIWEAIDDVHASWLAAGEPERPEIGLSVEREGRQRLWLRRPERCECRAPPDRSGADPRASLPKSAKRTRSCKVPKTSARGTRTIGRRPGQVEARAHGWSMHMNEETSTIMDPMAALLAVQLLQLRVLLEIERGVTVTAQNLDGILAEMRRERT
jgi:hypothetical protein